MLMFFPVHQSSISNVNTIVKERGDGFYGPQVRLVKRPKIEGGRRARWAKKSGHTRNTPTKPTGCKPATTKQQIASMIPAKEGK
jgi:hypothetical protein